MKLGREPVPKSFLSKAHEKVGHGEINSFWRSQTAFYFGAAKELFVVEETESTESARQHMFYVIGATCLLLIVLFVAAGLWSTLPALRGAAGPSTGALLAGAAVQGSVMFALFAAAIVFVFWLKTR